jgi:uncharacterized short protein YbdD (DUF466 family)
VNATARIVAAWRWLRELGRLIVGVPSYEAYVAHMRAQHPDVAPMTYEAFFENRLQARYGRGRSRCC